MRSCSEAGQAAVEAAIALPFLLAVLGLMLQPAILLYDRCVMQAAAAETCRLVATQTASPDAVEAYALRRLDAIPDADVFHVGGARGWQIDVEGGELSEATVQIGHAVSPFPVFGALSGLVLRRQPDGTCLQQVQVTSRVQPGWASELEGGPDDWIRRWD